LPALNNEPWWTLTSPTNNNILSIQVSPFFLQIVATGLSSTNPTASILGALTRILLILSSLTLIASSLRPSVWWRPITAWLSLATLTEVFFSLLLLIHIGQTALLTAYGTNPPTTGTISYPAKIIGTDLNTYPNPQLSATFTLDFFLGILSLTIVGTEVLLKILQERALFAPPIPSVKEFYLTPPYRRVWLSTADRELNPLRRDPENTTDDLLLESFTKIYNTIQPGGTVSIVLPSWASSVGNRFQKLLAWTGFEAEESETIYQFGNQETQLKFKKPLAPRDGASSEPEPEPEPAPVLAGALEVDTTLPETPPQLEVSAQPDWTLTKMTKQEKAVLRAAVSILSKQREPMPYRDLLSQVYMELVERRVQFESARQIESTLLRHNGRELTLTEEADADGFKEVKKWSLGDEELSPIRDQRPSILQKLSNHRLRVPPVKSLLKKWQRRSKYRPKHESAEEESESSA